MTWMTVAVAAAFTATTHNVSAVQAMEGEPSSALRSKTGGPPLLLYCPGDVRLSHQIDMLLGAIALCEAQGRSLVLLPLMQLQSAHRMVDVDAVISSASNWKLLPFDELFNASVLSQEVGTFSADEVSHDARMLEAPPAYCERPAAVGRRGIGGCRAAAESSPECSSFWQSLDYKLGEDAPYGQLLSRAVPSRTPCACARACSAGTLSSTCACGEQAAAVQTPVVCYGREPRSRVAAAAGAEKWRAVFGHSPQRWPVVGSTLQKRISIPSAL
eukprot:gnl/TRDRNA2_/TRDRNA2_171751_c1_seq1.p1 gnl/TRDRNA2_/TRDRNA2_171751_c1~~gnl/TRDRNA2_/TRDRNA2_171751_c1_seq1.p1  ORF type:complete len:272 (+),score=38.98 gnl/TRDRNA2_/TRDRNA2_171751_c1_seq1:107-922(+)